MTLYINLKHEFCNHTPLFKSIMLKKGTSAAELVIKRFPTLNNQVSQSLIIPNLPKNFHQNTLLCLFEEQYLNKRYFDKYHNNNIIKDNIKFFINQESVLALQQLEKAFPKKLSLIRPWRKKIQFKLFIHNYQRQLAIIFCTFALIIALYISCPNAFSPKASAYNSGPIAT